MNTTNHGYTINVASFLALADAAKESARVLRALQPTVPADRDPGVEQCLHRIEVAMMKARGEMRAD